MTTHTIRIKEETSGGNIVNEMKVKLASEVVSIKDIIEAKVNAQVEAQYQQLAGIYNGLVEPVETEKMLNVFTERPAEKINTEKQVNAALDAFRQNSFFMLIDNIQAESLDQMVVINDKTEVSFLKLTSLVGG
jgi:hypothetical protein